MARHKRELGSKEKGMAGKELSRRSLFGLVGAGAALGLGAWGGFHYFASRGGSAPNLADPAEPKPAPVQQVIDAHVHVVDTNLAGVPSGSAPDGTPFQGDLTRLAGSIEAQMKEANVKHALCMPSRELKNAKDPLGTERTRELAKRVPGLHPVGLADPERFDDKHMASVEAALKAGEVVAFKAYLGYLHHGPDSPGYRPYYRLAGDYKIPVIFHTGDNYSQKAKVKFAHPLGIDEVAVDYPGTNFVIAHMGNPWLMDAAEVIYKNNKKDGVENVWADLSALVIGSAKDFAKYRKEGVLKMVIEDVRKAIAYAERPDRFLFGSDWPLTPMNVYRDFIRELVPEEYHQKVFFENASKLFNLK
jgi:predicted TIM-barrel fold metal-dependent hydrolase